ncbi:sugar phosphate nucleotidyltransferase [Klebsiella pneumoniae]|uniref:sugar phosphate nucleotidyltransferase n=1 Tax=Klebsiella pneumoniae TaxID=573 RepID=UPI00388DE9F0
MLLPVIMAGGTGSRLWPMSRELYPKQFLRLYGQNSMLQETISRLSGLDTHEPMVICNEEHRFPVAEQLRQLGKLSKISSLSRWAATRLRPSPSRRCRPRRMAMTR